MNNDVKEILYSEEMILKKIKEMGEVISNDYKDKNLLIVVI